MAMDPKLYAISEVLRFQNKSIEGKYQGELWIMNIVLNQVLF